MTDAPGGVPPLYKYRSMAAGEAREHTLAVLGRRELWYSAASEFNDPFDCHLDVALRSREEWERAAALAARRLKAGLRALLGKGLRSLARAIEEKRGVKLPEWPAPSEAEREEERARHEAAAAAAPGKLEWTLTVGGVPRDPAEYFNEVTEQRMQKLYAMLDASFGVLCFSERPDDILLWSHYGSCHNGICLEFDAAADRDAFPRLHRVVYQDAYPEIPAAFVELLDFYGRKGQLEEGLLTWVDRFGNGLVAESGGVEPEGTDSEQAFHTAVARWFYTKSDAWRYEREWRSVKHRPGLQSFAPDALRRVIVGCVNTEANLELVREALREGGLEVPVYRAMRKRQQFGLDLVKARS